MHTYTKNWEKSPLGFRLRVLKRILFLSPMQCSILAIFETKDMTLCLHAYTGEKFPNFCIGGFPGPQNSHTHTHTPNHFTALLDFVRDYPGEPTPER